MESKQIVSPTWGTVLGYIVIWTLIFMIALCGCGARKTQTEIANKETVQDAKSNESTNVSTKESSSLVEAKTDQTAKVKEGSITTTTEEYANGGLVKKTVSVENKKSTDNSSKSSTRTFNQTRVREELKVVTITLHVKETEKLKVKSTDANNNKIWTVLGLCVALAILVGGVIAVIRSKSPI